MTAWYVHRWWLTRAAALLVATALIDAAVGGLAPKPFPWVALIPATLPVTMMVFVGLPTIKRAEEES